jgi:hypothetical protein
MILPSAGGEYAVDLMLCLAELVRSSFVVACVFYVAWGI